MVTHPSPTFSLYPVLLNVQFGSGHRVASTVNASPAAPLPKINVLLADHGSGFGFRLRVFSIFFLKSRCCAQGIMDDKKKLGASACFALALILGIASAASNT